MTEMAADRRPASRPGLTVLAVPGLPEIAPGDRLADRIADAVELCPYDVVVVTQKVVSKAEGRIVELDPDDPGHKARVIADETVRVLRRRGELVITETRHGFVCANAGVDLSNVAEGTAALLPVDPDRSARGIRAVLERRTGVKLAVVITDTFGRVWRRGVTDVAIGAAGILPVLDLRGTTDALGRELVATEICIVDEIAGAAELVMGKAAAVPVAVVRGIDPRWFGPGSVAGSVIRSYRDDLFR